jgi:23S rRNA (cytosine1962-C5)-methyltransferase
VSLPSVTLKAGHVQPVWAGHPWVYAQAVARVEGGARPGDEVRVVDPRGNFLGRGFYSPKSAIAVRILTRDEKETLHAGFFQERIERAIARRRELSLPSTETDAFRLVHAEGDGLPGLVVDVFRDVCVVQITSLGMKLREELLFAALQRALAPRAIVDRSPAEAARLEGFEPGRGVVRGADPAGELVFSERGLTYRIPPELGQKTGFYFDQRPLRARIEQLSHGRRVLDAFSFVGTFALGAARGGAKEVLAVDESAIAIEVGALIARENGFPERIRHVKEDARTALARVGREGGWDLVICDPPKLAKTRGARTDALVAYRKLASLGASATRPGGILVLCSCSAAVTLDALTRALALGARDAGRSAAVLERHFQGADHPVLAAFPEGLYLKSLIVRIDTV